jgi:hypothetical protein
VTPDAGFFEAVWNGTTSFVSFNDRLKWHKHWMDERNIAYGGEDKNLLSLALKYQPDQMKWKVTALAGPSDLDLRFTIMGHLGTGKKATFLQPFHPNYAMDVYFSTCSVNPGFIVSWAPEFITTVLTTALELSCG